MRGWYVIDDLLEACGEFQIIPLAVEICDVSVPDVVMQEEVSNITRILQKVWSMEETVALVCPDLRFKSNKS